MNEHDRPAIRRNDGPHPIHQRDVFHAWMLEDIGTGHGHLDRDDARG